MKILAVFADPDSARKAMGRLAPAVVAAKDASLKGGEYEVYSSEPLEPAAVRSRVGKITFLGGLLGGIGGWALAALTAKSMGLYTGGMPLVAYAPVGIITFAATALGAVGAAFGTLLWEADLLRLRLELPEQVRQEVAAGAVAVAVEVEEDRRAAVEEVLAHAGGRIQQIA